MPSVCLYFQVHQPFRLKGYNFFRIGEDHFYEDDKRNAEILAKVARKCYLPANKTLLDLIRQHQGSFKIAFSITGTVWEQFEKYAPEVCDSFQALFATGHVELLAETYYHSLSFLRSPSEFIRQVGLHKRLVNRISGQEPKVFRNTELIYNNEISKLVHNLGFEGILCEGVDRILTGRSPNFVYHAKGCPDMKCLLKNYKLSDDVAFRFSDKHWSEFPLTATHFAHWIHQVAGNGDTVNLFMDYETFGEHQWVETGIFNFLKNFPLEVFRHKDFTFNTPSEVIKMFPARGEYDSPEYISWADLERDLSAWLGNELQRDALERVMQLETAVKATQNQDIVSSWGKLLTSDHFYYMCTKYWNDGDVHKYFSPYNSPHDAYINYMNTLSDLELSVEAVEKAKRTRLKGTSISTVTDHG